MPYPVKVAVDLTADTMDFAFDPTYLNEVDSHVRSVEINRGRQDELSRTGTGTARVDLVITAANESLTPWDEIRPMMQAYIQLYNPFADDYTTIFRGYVEDFEYDGHPSQQAVFATMNLVDGFEVLGAIEMAPGGSFGDSPPGWVDPGMVFYDDAANVRLRMLQLLGDAGWSTAFLTSIFTGNVVVDETVYSPGTTILSALQDAADAEFPGVANVWMSKVGEVAFRGRQSRFRPDVAEYLVSKWYVGDFDAIEADDRNAQLRSVGFAKQKQSVINAAVATPQSIRDEEDEEAAFTAQIVTDSASITTYGTRSWSAENLLTYEGVATGNNALEETKLFATYYVANYSDPEERVKSVSVKTVRPDDPRAERVWAFLCGVELNDMVTLDVGLLPDLLADRYHDYFVEGLRYEITPLHPDYANVTLTLDLSPRANYNTNPFEADTDPE